MNDLLVLDNIDLAALFVDKNKIDMILKKIEHDAFELIDGASLETATSRKEYSSAAYKVARSKTALDNAGKELVADWKSKSKKVDEVRKHCRDFLDDLGSRVRKPLTDFEEAEAARIAKEKSEAEFQAAWDEAVDENNLYDRRKEIERKEAEFAMANETRKRAEAMRNHINDCRNGVIGGTPQPFAILLRELEAKVIIDESYGEYAEELQTQADEAHVYLINKMNEQASIRAAEDARKEKERLEEARQQAYERAKRESEMEKKAAEERAAKAEQDRIAAIERAKVEAEMAKKRAEEAQALAVKQAEEKARREADAKEAARIAEEARKKAEADRLAQDKAHRRDVNLAALADFEQSGIDTETAKKVIKLIALGWIRYIRIEY